MAKKKKTKRKTDVVQDALRIVEKATGEKIAKRKPSKPNKTNGKA